ncbi:hypothetical protein AB1N83_012980, partial [Pleurotus pulmonarius]
GRAQLLESSARASQVVEGQWSRSPSLLSSRKLRASQADSVCPGDQRYCF